MTTGIRAQLEHGQQVMSLTAGPYFVGIDLDLPVIERQTQLARGNLINRYSGDRPFMWRAVNATLSFSIVVAGDSEAEVRHAIRRLDTFLSYTTDETPLYLALGGHSDLGFEPRWGQFGAMSRYRIVEAVVGPVPGYTIPDLRAKKLRVPMLLTISPYALGLVQKACLAKGGLLEDTIGTVDGLSRGTMIPEAITNKMTNPVFVDATAFDTGWTVGTNIIRDRNDDPEFILFGKVSVKLTAKAATLNTYTQSINAGNTNAHVLSAYVRLPDAGVPTSADAALYYNAIELTTAYIAQGNGWYRMVASVTGIASAVTTGVIVKNSRTVYTDGFQLEELVYPTPLAHGDMLGCAWTGTAGASTTSRTGAEIEIPRDILLRHALDRAQGTIRVVWKAPFAFADYPGAPVNRFFFLSDVVRHHAYMSLTSDTFQFSDGTAVITSPVQDFAAGEILVLHFTWGPGFLKMYRAAAEIASGSSYTPFSETAPKIKIGTSGSGFGSTGGTYMDFTTFDVAMTPAQITADYTNLLKEVENNRRLMPIPWVWTKTGLGRVENCLDSTSTNHAVAGGIAGSAPALVELKLQPVTIWSGAKNIWISNSLVDKWVPPSNSIFFDFSGTADTSACGDAVQEFTVTTAENVIQPTQVQSYEFVGGKDIYLLARLKDAGTGLQAKIRIERGLTLYETEFRSLAADATYRLFVLGPIPVWSYSELVMDYADFRIDKEVRIDLVLKRGSGSAVVSLDFYQIMPRPLAQIVASLSTTEGPRVKESRVSTRLNTDDSILTIDRLTGDIVELWPDKLNILQTLMGIDGLEVQVDDEKMDFTDVFVTPRWGVL